MKNEQETLLGILIKAGIDSRRKLAAAIMGGQVTVNGEVVDNLRSPVDPEKDVILLKGRKVKTGQERFVYLVMNKPEGVLSAVRDDRGRETVIDFVPIQFKKLRLYPVGRLDIETTGLILLTNDGELTNRLTHPSFENEKEYYIHIRGSLNPQDIRKLENGVRLEDGPTYPAAVKEITDDLPYQYSVTIHEGRKRQVRRMFASLGYHTNSLKRVRMGSLTLGDLKEGEIRELGGDEVKRVFAKD
ncbi:pseudouridine synthase [Chloroflexota bacterium]